MGALFDRHRGGGLGVEIPPMDGQTPGFIDRRNCIDPAIFNGITGQAGSITLYVWRSRPVADKLS
jgi:hypothetical protein